MEERNLTMYQLCKDKKNELSNSMAGITLVALVVTIVVLLILAGITINVLFSDNGIIKKSFDAKEQYIIGQEKEQIALAYTDCKTDNYINSPDDVRVQDYQLEDALIHNGNDVTVTTENDDLQVKYNDTNHRYTVTEDGQIIEETPLTPEELNNIVRVEGLMGRAILAETASGKVLYSSKLIRDSLSKLELESCDVITEDGIKQVEDEIFIDNKGKVYAWQDTNQLPICLNGDLKGKNITKIISGNYFKAVQDENGKLYTWGRSSYGLLGDGTTEESYSPKCLNDIPGNALYGKQIVRVLYNIDSMVVFDKDGKVYIWGNNNYGQLGNGTTKNVCEPICINDIPGTALYGKQIVKIFESAYTINILDSNGKLYTCGYNSYGQLGNGTTNHIYVPICISDIAGSALENKKIEDIISTAFNKIAIDSEGKVYTWGKNDYGQLGNGNTKDRSIPICISDIEGSALKNKKITKVEKGNSYKTYIIARDENGKVYTWGGNEYCKLGNGAENDTNIPICISDIPTSSIYNKNIVEIFTGDSTMARDIDGKLHMWGTFPYYADHLIKVDSSVPVCISDISGSILNDKKIVEVYDRLNIVKDNNGGIYTSRDNVVICLNDKIESPLYNKTIIEMDGNYLIDNEGNLYNWNDKDEIVNITYENSPENLLYNKKIDMYKTSHASGAHDVDIFSTGKEVFYSYSHMPD